MERKALCEIKEQKAEGGVGDGIIGSKKSGNFLWRPACGKELAVNDRTRLAAWIDRAQRRRENDGI